MAETIFWESISVTIQQTAITSKPLTGYTFISFWLILLHRNVLLEKPASWHSCECCFDTSHPHKCLTCRQITTPQYDNIIPPQAPSLPAGQQWGPQHVCFDLFQEKESEVLVATWWHLWGEIPVQGLRPTTYSHRKDRFLTPDTRHKQDSLRCSLFRPWPTIIHSLWVVYEQKIGWPSSSRKCQFLNGITWFSKNITSLTDISIQTSVMTMHNCWTMCQRT